MELSITLVIIIITCIVSFGALGNQQLMDKLIFYPPAVTRDKEWYRFFSCGLIHADFGHLAFNMYALYIFGEGVSRGPGLGKTGLEYEFIDLFGNKGKLLYLLMYVLAFAVCLIPTYSRNRNNYNYKSLGASGAVSAVVFASILLNPLGYMGLLFIPVYMVSFLFGGLYLAVSYYLDKRGAGHINHSAHFWGALFGILFLWIAAAAIIHLPLLSLFVEQVKNFDLSQILRTQ